MIWNWQGESLIRSKPDRLEPFVILAKTIAFAYDLGIPKLAQTRRTRKATNLSMENAPKRAPATRNL
jgi:hypothetical protein